MESQPPEDGRWWVLVVKRRQKVKQLHRNATVCTCKLHVDVDPFEGERRYAEAEDDMVLSRGAEGAVSTVRNM